MIIGDTTLGQKSIDKMNECLVSDDGLHSAIVTPEWEDDDEFETGGLVCRFCGEILE